MPAWHDTALDCVARDGESSIHVWETLESYNDTYVHG